MSSSGFFSFGSLYDSQPAEKASEHWGHIQCHCGHHADESVQEAKTNGRIHLDGQCMWSCCKANWSDFVCTCPVSRGSDKSMSGIKEIPVPDSDEKEREKFRRFLPTFFTQELICLSCFKPYRNPMKLICGHTLCRECIEKVVAYQKAAGSFSSRFRAAPPSDSSAEATPAKLDEKTANLRLRQMSRTQRHILMGDGKAKEDDTKMTDGEETVNKDYIMCPVCSVCSYVREAVEDVETVQKMRELVEQRRGGVRPKCSFCKSAVLSGAQAGEAEDATLMCSTCGPICARHHALLHIAGPPMFRSHEVNETPLELVSMNVIPHAYEICPKHGCEMDLYDKSTERPMCEVCVASLSKRDVANRIIRDEDKTAYFMEKQAKRAREEDAKMKAKKSAEELEAEEKRNEIKQIGEIHESLRAKTEKCREILQKSRALQESGALTREVKGLAEMREELKNIFAESHKALEEMQKQAEESIAKIIDDADGALKARYEASETLLRGADEASERSVRMSLEQKNVRKLVMKRLKDVQDQLNTIDALPVEPLEVSALLTMSKGDSMDKLHLVNIQANNRGLFAGVGAAEPAAASSEMSDSPQPVSDEDEDAILERIRAKLKEEERKDTGRRSRENGRYSTVRSTINSGMSDDMKTQAVGSIIFERGMDVLGVDFDEVFTVSSAFLEKNPLERILSDLNQPADFNLELRAIYQFLKETKKL